MRRNSFILLSGVFSLMVGLHANPTSPVVQSGQVIFDHSGQLLKIEASDKAIIEWKDFSIGEGECTQFLQPGFQASVLNRVPNGPISKLLGTLVANGKVVLLNPQGVLIGKNGVIDTAGFIAASLQMSDQEFQSGDFYRFQGNPEGSVINLGKIRATDGDALLIGYQVVNEGTIEAPKGVGGLAAGLEILVQPLSDEHIFIRTAASDHQDLGIDQNGIIDALQVEVKADGNLYSLAIRTNGKINARGVVEKDGRVFLVSPDGRSQIDGNITAINQDAIGGEIAIRGKDLHVLPDAYLDASGEKGGGSIEIGRDFNALTLLPTDSIIVEQGAVLKADAEMQGQGGEVLLYAEGSTGFYGQISAEGGALSGDGGFVEVSGENKLDIKGIVSTLAPNGKTGQLLLDPADIVVAIPTEHVTDTTGAGTTTVQGDTSNITPCQISAASVVTLLASNNVVISTTDLGTRGQHGTIVVSEAISWNTNHNLTLSADDDIYIGAAIGTTAGTASLTIHGDQTNEGHGPFAFGVYVNAPISMTNGDISITSDLAVVQIAQPITTQIGNITLKSNASNGGVLISNHVVVIGSGDIDITTPGGVPVGADGPSAVFSLKNTRRPSNRAQINITASDIIVGDLGSNFAFIGCPYDLGAPYVPLGTTEINADINITYSGNLVVGADTTVNLNPINSRIGHAGSSLAGTPLTTINGDITITTTNANNVVGVELIGSGVGDSYAQIGHSPNLQADTLIQGNVHITGQTSKCYSVPYLLSRGGMNSPVFIGHGSTQIISGITTYSGLTSSTPAVIIDNISSGILPFVDPTTIISLTILTFENPAGIGFYSNGGTTNFTNPPIVQLTAPTGAIGGEWTLTSGSSAPAAPADAFIGLELLGFINGAEACEVSISAHNTNITLNNATSGPSFNQSFIGVRGSDDFEAGALAATVTIDLFSPIGNVTLNANAGAALIIDFANIISPTATYGIQVTVPQNIAIHGSTRNVAFISGGDSVFLSAGNQIQMSSPSSVNAAIIAINAITLVTDANFPNPPSFGPGGFVMDANSEIFSVNHLPVAIYTARPQQNTISGLINFASWSLGTYLIDNPENQYGIYYPNGTLSSPFTIFYKIQAQANTSPAFQKVLVFENFIFELNYDLDNEDIYWEPGFYVSYGQKPKSYKRSRGFGDKQITSYDVQPTDDFFLHTKKYLYYRGYTF